MIISFLFNTDTIETRQDTKYVKDEAIIFVPNNMEKSEGQNERNKQ